MPLFEYKCAKCGHVMEVLQPGRDAVKQTCEKCGGTDMKKLLSGFSVGQSKGSSKSACDSCAAGPAFGGGCGCGGACPMG